MSSASSKKDRLSLSKKRKQKDVQASTPTILSMFKKQREKQESPSEDIDKTVGESGSESDVVITKVVKSSSGTVMSKLDNDDDNDDSSTRNAFQESRGNEKHTDKANKGRGMKTTTLHSRNEATDDKKNDKSFQKLSKQSRADRRKDKKVSDRSDDKDSDKLCVESETKTDGDNDKSIRTSKYWADDHVDVKQVEKRSSSRLKTRSVSADSDVHVIEDDIVPRKKRKLTLKKSNTDSEISKKRKMLKNDEMDCAENLENNDKLVDISDDTELEKDKINEEETDVKDEINAQSDKTYNQEQENKLAKHKDKAKGLTLKKSTSKSDNKSNSDSVKTVKEEKKTVVSDKKVSDKGTAKLVANNSSDVDKISDNKSEVTDIKDEDVTEGEEPIYQVPYYLENFHTIIDSVLADTEYARLFDASDMLYITAFREMSEPCQKLYVRIFGRKLSWLPMVKLKYPGIGDDIPSLVDQLITTGFLKSGEDLDDLPVLLKLLSAPDLKALAKTFHINTTNTTKPKLIELLTKKSQQSSIGSLFAGGNSASSSTLCTMIKRAKGYLGKISRLEENVRAVFIRLLMLFCLYNTNFDEDNGSVGQNQLFQMLMVNIGKVTYPSYTVNKQRPVFKDREAVVRFETALQLEMDLLHLIDRNKWADAYIVYEQARVVGEPILKNKQYRKWDENLPEFLRLYTAGCIYLRIANQGVELLQRQKKYTEAVSLLGEMLAQKLYCNQYRGHWYERLALNLDAHLKKPAQSLDVIKRGLSDVHVRSGRKLAIYERAKKICEAPKSKFTDRMKEFMHDPVTPPPETTIEGMVISDATSMGMKYQFVMQGDSDSTTFCAVEELVLEHYKNNGYPNGLHAEGSIIGNLFTLYFWDILYMDIEDVFQGPHQSCPLDLYTREFYEQRKDAVDIRLEWIKNAIEQELIDEIQTIWDEHCGKMCIGLNWEKFTGPETHQGLVSCMNGPMIAGVLERYVKDPRHTRSGFPDLTLWNTETKTIKISEVKGPNDRLSYKQILWIDYLLKLGIDAEVCYVKAVGSKKLKPTKST